MARIVFYTILLLFVVRALRNLWRGIAEGLTQPSTGRGGVPARGVAMVRDPICGTFVVPDRAVALSVGPDQVFFCSVTCRDKYRGQSLSHPHDVEGRTA
jgi:hypothetical protein